MGKHINPAIPFTGKHTRENVKQINKEASVSVFPSLFTALRNWEAKKYR